MTIPQKGAAAAFLSYLWWGSMPLYWKALSSVSSSEILGHRVVWSAIFTFALIAVTGQWHKTTAFAVKNKRKTLWLFLGYLITLNWGLYIWAVNAGRILETSLGYYINPLVSMFFGMLFFGEKLRRAQRIAIAIAAAGVCIQIITIREIPLVSLGLALSFGLYGVLKKAVSIEPSVALLIETLSAAPAALAYLCWLQHTGAANFPYSLTTDLLLAGTGVMTSVPLLLFAYAAQRITDDDRLYSVRLPDNDIPDRHLHIQRTALHPPDNNIRLHLERARRLLRRHRSLRRERTAAAGRHLESR